MSKPVVLNPVSDTTITTTYTGIMLDNEVANIPVGFGIYASPTQAKWLTWFAYFAIIFASIILILVIIYMFNHTFRKKTDSVPFTDIGPDFIDGSQEIPFDGSSFQNEATCNSQNGRAVWTGHYCACAAGMYGASCNFERYPTQVFCVANSSFDFDFQSEEVSSNRLFYNEDGTLNPNSCINQCDFNENCTGITYNDNVCRLIIGEIHIKSGRIPVYDVKQQCNMFAYSNNQIKSNDIVYAFQGTRPLRYYSNATFDNFTVLNVDDVNEVTFVPTTITNQGHHLGVWCPTNFNKNQFEEKRNDLQCIKDNNTVNDEYTIDIPFGPPVYAMYR